MARDYQTRAYELVPVRRHSCWYKRPGRATRQRNCYLAAQYRRLAGRRGKKQALIAVAHSLLVIIYHIIKRGTNYQELGADFFDRTNKERLTRHLIRRLESLGNEVKVQPVAVAV